MAAPPLADGDRESRAIRVLGDAATVRGFRLAGLGGTVVADAREAHAALARMREERAALVIVTEPVAEWLGGPEALVFDGVRPLVVTVPSARAPASGARLADHLARRVQRALGLAGEQRP
jgi:vacuolar-type H+-ATPase subunit F/Vma7